MAIDLGLHYFKNRPVSNEFNSPPKRVRLNPSTPKHKCRGLLRVDPERRFFTPPSKAGLGAAERVKSRLDSFPACVSQLESLQILDAGKDIFHERYYTMSSDKILRYHTI